MEAVVSPIGEMRTTNWCTNKNQFFGSYYTDGAYATDTGMLTLIPLACPTWMNNLAATRAYLALKNQKVNLSVAFAEREQAKKMFAQNAKEIARQVQRFRRLNPRLWGQVIKNGALNQWKGIPSKWLELQYGWKPLMSDILGACEVLANLETGVMAYHARVKGSAKWTERYNFNLASSPYYWICTAEREYHTKYILYYKLNNPTLAALSSLGITNPLELGWELVKYSFVIDWFLPVGNWLSTLDADFGWTYETGCQTNFIKVNTTSIPRHIPNTLSAQYDNFTVGPKMKGIRMTRQVVGPPAVGVPHFKNPLSSVHIANAMSLLSQAFR